MLTEELPKEVLNEYLLLGDRLKSLDDKEKCSDHFLDFVKLVWPEFIEGRHHRVIAKKFEQVATGELKRLIINMPPRHTKSEFASYLFPAWLIGQKPDLKIIQTTHTGELAVRFGRKMRNLVDSSEYGSVFPNTKLRADTKAAGRWVVSYTHLTLPTKRIV